MKLTVLGAASIAAMALVACAKKETKTEETATAETTAAADTAEAAPADIIADAAPETTDVYAGSTVDLGSVRTKDALTAASDAAFAQADADANGSLSQTEFYSLAALMTPAEAADTVVDTAVDAAAGAVADAAGAAVGEVAGAPAGDAAEAVVAGVAGEPAAADTKMLDASYATIAGADASLTTDDLRAAFLSRFDAADVNLDGSLDDAEAATFKSAMLF